MNDELTFKYTDEEWGDTSLMSVTNKDGKAFFAISVDNPSAPAETCTLNKEEIYRLISFLQSIIK